MREMVVPLEILRPERREPDLATACGKPLLRDAALAEAEDRRNDAGQTGR